MPASTLLRMIRGVITCLCRLRVSVGCIGERRQCNGRRRFVERRIPRLVFRPRGCPIGGVGARGSADCLVQEPSLTRVILECGGQHGRATLLWPAASGTAAKAKAAARVEFAAAVQNAQMPEAGSRPPMRVRCLAMAPAHLPERRIEVPRPAQSPEAHSGTSRPRPTSSRANGQAGGTVLLGWRYRWPRATSASAERRCAWQRIPMPSRFGRLRASAARAARARRA
jgi:hypothetical protein